MSPAEDLPDLAAPVAGASQGTADDHLFRPRLRLVVGLGDPERARSVLSALSAAGDITVVEQCLTTDRLLECVRGGHADAALVAADLHRLSGERRDALAQAGIALVLMAPDSNATGWDAFPGTIVAAGAGPRLVRDALTAALRGERRRYDTPEHQVSSGRPVPPAGPGATSPAPPTTQESVRSDGVVGPSGLSVAPVDVRVGHMGRPVARPPAAAGPGGGRDEANGVASIKSTGANVNGLDVTAPGFVLVVGSGHGSPGSTTVAANLAVALGAAAPTVLVDASLVAPSVAAVLPLDRTRNLVMLAHDDPRTAEEWDRALARETQPLAARSPHGRVLCGVPRPALRAAVTAAFVGELFARLRERFWYVVVDLGDVAELPGGETGVAGAQRAALAAADHVCLVAAPDPVGVWRAQETRDVLRAHAAVAPERTTLVLNHYDSRRHHRRSEIEWTLGLPAAAVVPHDHGRVQRALGELQPVVLDERSAAGRALLDFAERLFGGDLTLPSEAAASGGTGRSGTVGWWRPPGWADAPASSLAGAVALPLADVLAGLRGRLLLIESQLWRLVASVRVRVPGAHDENRTPGRRVVTGARARVVRWGARARSAVQRSVLQTRETSSTDRRADPTGSGPSGEAVKDQSSIHGPPAARAVAAAAGAGHVGRPARRLARSGRSPGETRPVRPRGSRARRST